MTEEKQPDFIKIPGLAFEIATHDEPAQTWYEVMRERKDGWRLPTADELHQIGELYRAAKLPHLNLTDGYYWSSTEVFNYNSRLERFSDGTQGYGSKNSAYVVRCVRDERFSHSVIPAEKPDGGAAFPRMCADRANNILHELVGMRFYDDTQTITMTPESFIGCMQRAALAGVEVVTVEELDGILGSHIPFNYSGELSMNSVRDLMERYPNGLKIIGEKP